MVSMTPEEWRIGLSWGLAILVTVEIAAVVIGAPTWVHFMVGTLALSYAVCLFIEFVWGDKIRRRP